MPKTYDANCHCGLIKYTVTLDEPLAPEGNGDICNCNCSICTKNGTNVGNIRYQNPLFDMS